MHPQLWRILVMLALFRCTPLLAKIDLPAGKDVLSRYEARTYTDPAGQTLLYRLFKPGNYDPNRRYPLILFLHGAGGRGNDNAGQITDGIYTAAGYASRTVQSKYPCFVVAPQCPADQRWVEVDWAADSHTQPAEPSDGLRMTMQVLAALQKEFSIDPDRLYITGLSMGGYGTWDLITRYPDVFAAAVPVCGGGDENQASRIAHLPIWAFHGGKDAIVKPLRSRNMIAAIRKAGGNPKYTEYPNIAHDSWLRAYTEDNLLPWLFAQKRPAK